MAVTSGLWGENGEVWSPQSRLPDFSYAGYQRGEVAIPNPAVVANVRNFGAVGDGVADDTAAFKSAITATLSGAILVPAGRYKITDFVTIAKSNVVLRGEGAGVSVLYFPLTLTDVLPNWGETTSGQPTSNYSWGGGFLNINGSLGQSDRASIVAPFATRGDTWLPLSMVSGLLVGQWVTVKVTDDAALSLTQWLYNGDSGSLTSVNPQSATQVAKITEIDTTGKRVRIDAPLRFDIQSIWNPKLQTFNPTVQNSGVEDLGFESRPRAEHRLPLHRLGDDRRTDPRLWGEESRRQRLAGHGQPGGEHVDARDGELHDRLGEHERDRFRLRGSSTAVIYTDNFLLYQPLTAPWASQDVGTVGLGGVGGTLGGKFVLQGSGGGIGGTADRGQLVSRAVTGDVQITARVLALDATNLAAKAGVMIRESTATGARSATVNWTPSFTAEFIRRTTTSGTSSTDTAAGMDSPPWVRLARRGNVFTAHTSPDAVTWTRRGAPVTIAMSTSALAALAVCSQDDTLLTDAVLDHVSVGAPPPDVRITSPTTTTAPVSLTGTSTRLRLTAAITDAGTPTVAWSKVSGPGTVTFANAAAADTTATFSQTESYVLQCDATGAAGTGSEEITVMVNAASDSAFTLWLRLNESAGTTAADAAGGDNPATVNGGVTWASSGGVVAGAAQFDGSSGFLSAPDAAALDVAGAFTLAYWFRADALNGSGHVSKRTNYNDNNAFTTFLQTDGLLNVDINSSNDRFTSVTDFVTGEWYHDAVVFDGSLAAASRARLYVNGVLDIEADESSPSVPNYNSIFRAGLTHTGGTFLNGALDDIRLYKRALPATEISALAAAKFLPVVSSGTAPAATRGTQPDNAAAAVTRIGANLEFNYTRRKVAAGEATFVVEWSDTLAANSWSSAGVTEQILTDNGTVQTVKATLPDGSSGHRFVHLKVTSP